MNDDDDNIILLKHLDLLIIYTVAKYNKVFATNRCAYDDYHTTSEAHISYALMQLFSSRWN